MAFSIMHPTELDGFERGVFSALFFVMALPEAIEQYVVLQEGEALPLAFSVTAKGYSPVVACRGSGDAQDRAFAAQKMRAHFPIRMLVQKDGHACLAGEWEVQTCTYRTEFKSCVSAVDMEHTAEKLSRLLHECSVWSHEVEVYLYQSGPKIVTILLVQVTPNKDAQVAERINRLQRRVQGDFQRFPIARGVICGGFPLEEAAAVAKRA